MLAVIRIRGNVGRRQDLKDALDIMGLSKPNTCVIIPDSPESKGIVKKVKDSVSFGKIDVDTLTKILRKRGRLEGNRRLTDETVKETGYDTIEKLSMDLFERKVKIRNVPKLKPVFRFSPPSKGFKSVKQNHPRGDLGNKGASIIGLIERMI